MIRKFIKNNLPKFRLTTIGSLNLANDQIKALKQIIAEYEAAEKISQQSISVLESRETKLGISLKWDVLDSLDSIRFPKDQLLTCKICGHSAEQHDYKNLISQCAFGGGKLIRFICPGCGCIFGPLKILNMEQAELSEEYKRHYSVFTEGDSTELELKAFYSLNPTKTGKYLNYGCGSWSKTIQQLRQEGYDVWGFEPYASTESPFILNKLSAVEQEKYDGIFTNNLLEHLQDPIGYFKFIRTILKDENSLIAHSTPCYEYAFDYTRFHVFFFTGKSIEVICMRSGYKVVKIESDRAKNYINYLFCIEQA